MELSTVKKSGYAPALFLSIFLLALTGTANKVEANPAPSQPINGAQLAWWHGGGYGWGGYYRPGYYRGGCNCWINRWGHRRCNCF